MTDTACHRESEVLAAVTTGTISDELRIHAMACPDCVELVLVAGFMNRGAAELQDAGPLPDPEYLWWRANLKQREIQSQRATSAITLVQRVSVVAGALVTLMLLRGILPELISWFGGLKSAAPVFSIPGGMASPSLVILVCLGLLAAPKVFDLYGA